MNLIILILFSAAIGYLAQTTGLCMVRGVQEWIAGERVRLLAILFSGFWVYLYLPLITQDQLGLAGYEWHWSFFFGGLLFGVGAAANSACSISTATRLSSGDIPMIFTMIGWLGGWLLLESLGINFDRNAQVMHNSQGSWILISGLIAASVWILFRRREYWRVWSGIMLVGMLAGGLFILQPAWSPSDLVRDLGIAILSTNPQLLPALDRLIILMAMLLGMGLGAHRSGKFQWVLPTFRNSGKHLVSGVLMGLGSAISLGGNDFQLMMGLPAQSWAGVLAIAGMILGIRIGIAAKPFLSKPNR